MVCFASFCKVSSIELQMDKTSIENMKNAIVLCDLSYKNIDEISALNNQFNECLAIENNVTDTQCFLFVLNNMIYIVFRGTSSFQDMKQDIKIMLVPSERCSFSFMKNIKVHKGFLEQYESIRDSIISQTIHLSEKYNINTFVVCGHSLGGGLATIAAPDLSTIFKNMSVYTIGSPRAGNHNFKNYFNEMIKSSYRITLKKDPIQYLPMSSKYVHVQKSHTIIDDRFYLVDNQKTFIKRLFNLTKNLDLSDVFKNHMTDTYIKAIEKMCLHSKTV